MGSGNAVPVGCDWGTRGVGWPPIERMSAGSPPDSSPIEVPLSHDSPTEGDGRVRDMSGEGPHLGGPLLWRQRSYISKEHPAKDLGVVSGCPSHPLPTDTRHLPPDLTLIDERWEYLPESTRAAVLALRIEKDAPRHRTRGS